ncbi:MAG: hypothetical protein ABJF11_02680 [Reichenbachiella sp.]|uniref:hypothetical protein n=1 Tax=Reichenbachiella sp. TaxID=2184521 RepID=UPI003267817E
MKLVFERINFADRYRVLCDSFQDFENRLNGSQKALCEDVLNGFEYEYKYYSNGSFYQISQEIDGLVFQLNLVLKGGLVESLLYMNKDGNTIEPKGRIDFFPEDLDIPFDRKKYNLPIYTSLEDLQQILIALFKIYEDIKKEVLAG